jgi:ribosomal-protein-alanine N-acetyltransferase
MTIAVWPRWRGLGLGEWLLLTLLKEGRSLGADYATLEVRPSNRAAISLYQKYRFQEVGRRTAYYSDNGEDALILTTPSIVLTDYKVLLIQRQQQLTRHLGQIQVDKIGHTG